MTLIATPPAHEATAVLDQPLSAYSEAIPDVAITSEKIAEATSYLGHLALNEYLEPLKEKIRMEHENMHAPPRLITPSYENVAPPSKHMLRTQTRILGRGAGIRPKVSAVKHAPRRWTRK